MTELGLTAILAFCNYVGGAYIKTVYLSKYDSQSDNEEMA
jgi:hypothetical protein